MTVGILACDHVTAPDGRDFSDMFVDLLASVDESIEFVVFDVIGGELPDDARACDTWLITGSRRDAFGDEPWTVALREFVRAVAEVRVRMVGVCFGHQAIAHALGGRAGRAGTWTGGVLPVEVEPTHWFAGGTVGLAGMHQDTVLELPPGARSIGVGPTSQFPMYLIGDTILGIQDHPEFDREYVAALIEESRAVVGDAITDRALESVATTDADNAIVARWIVDFLADRRR